METTKKIAVFGPNHKLIAITGGISQASRLIGADTGSLLRALNGERITCGGLYVRWIPEDTVVDMDDLNKADLIEFDLEWLEEDRLVYTTRRRKRNNVIKESDFVKIRGDRYRQYNFNTNKKRK